MAEVLADLAANVWRVLATEGTTVADGEVLMILESMKMEIPVEAPQGGIVVAVRVAEGDTVDEGVVLAVID
jgi:acetyl-CoA carboxylase biotin carboxyl carrier protein